MKINLKIKNPPNGLSFVPLLSGGKFTFKNCYVRTKDASKTDVLYSQLHSQDWMADQYILEGFYNIGWWTDLPVLYWFP
jgi:hypothetical protein